MTDIVLPLVFFERYFLSQQCSQSCFVCYLVLVIILLSASISIPNAGSVGTFLTRQVSIWFHTVSSYSRDISQIKDHFYVCSWHSISVNIVAVFISDDFLSSCVTFVELLSSLSASVDINLPLRILGDISLIL